MLQIKLIFLLPVILLFGCSSDINKQPNLKFGEILHPYDNQNLNPELIESITSLNESDQSKVIDENRLVKQFSLGKFFGEPHESLINVRDVSVQYDGKVYILDGEYNQIHVIDSTGQLITSLSRNGRGPGELMNPTSIDVTDDYIIVSDGLLKLSFFRTDNYEHAFDHLLDFFPEKICSINNSIFIQGISYKNENLSNYLIHRFELNGERDLRYNKSFGKLYPSSSQYVSKQLSAGKIVCDKNNKNVLFTYNWIPIISSYTLDGKFRWEKKIADFKPIKIITGTLDDGRQYVKRGEPDTGYFDVISGFVSDHQGNIYVQILRREKSGLKTILEILNNSKYFTVVIDSESGNGKSFYGTHDGLGGINENYVLMMEPDFTKVFPKLILYKLNY